MGAGGKILLRTLKTGHRMQTLETLYETTPKLHGILMIKQAASMAWIKQRTAACDELSRVE